MNTTPITELLAEVREALSLPKTEDNTLEVNPDSDEAVYLIALYAEQDALALEAARLTKLRGAVTKVLADLCPDGATITIGGEELFTRRIDSTRAINVKALKAEFPDEPDNAEFWTTNIVTKSIWATHQPAADR